MKINYSEKDKVVFFIFCGSIFLASRLFLGISDPHAWRQSDVYAHILGFMGTKGLTPLTDFLGERTIYDIPIYQWIIAKISIGTASEPLAVARAVNIALWAITGVFGYKTAESLHQNAGLLFLFLFTTSPVLIHYFSAPMVDNLAIAGSSVVLYLILKKTENITAYATALVLIFVASLIKSPVAFTFVTLYVCINLNGSSKNRIFSTKKLYLFLSIALIGALVAELIRKSILNTNFSGFAQDPWWYFGSLEQRFSMNFWQTIGVRILDFFPTHTFGYLVFFPIVVMAFAQPLRFFKLLWPFMMTYLLSWLIFSNVFFIHDYYQMPVSLFMFMGIAVFYAHMLTPILNNRSMGIFHVCLILVTPLLLFKHASYKEPTFDSIFLSLRHALKDSENFLFVNYLGKAAGPVMGGRLKTPFQVITHKEFESDCQGWLSKANAIVVEGRSNCFEQAVGPFKTYIDNLYFQAYVRP